MKPLPSSRRQRCALWLGASAAFFAVLLPTSATRATDDPAPPSAHDEPPARIATRLDRWHEAVTDALSRAIERFDRLFGDRRLEEEDRGTRLAVIAGVRSDTEEGATLENRIRLRIALPNLERRLLLLFEEDNLEDAELPPKTIAETVREARPLTGLRLALLPLGKARVSVDGGVRLGGDPQIVTRGRLSLVKTFELWERRLTQSVAWYSQDGWTATAEARWTRRLGEELLFRATTAVGWGEARNGITPSQTFDLLRAVGTVRGHRWTARGEWPETPSCRQAFYELEYAYRRRLYRDWLYGEIAAGVDFAQERHYDPNPFAALRLEIVFGE